MEETVSIEEIIKLLKRRWILIVSFMFIGLGLSAGVTFFLQPLEYSGSAQLLIQSDQEDLRLNTDAINTNVLLLDTYKDLIKNPSITGKISERYNAESGDSLTTAQISSMVEIRQNQKSQLFLLNATTSNPEQAALLANIAAEVFKVEVNELNEQIQISIASRAIPNETPVSPNVSVNLALGVVLGIVIGVLMTFVLELFNKTVKSSEYISETLNIPVLGTIGLIDSGDIVEYRQKQRMMLNDSSMIEGFSDNDMNLQTSKGSQDGLDLDLKSGAQSYSQKQDMSEKKMASRSERFTNEKRRR